MAATSSTAQWKTGEKIPSNNSQGRVRHPPGRKFRPPPGRNVPGENFVNPRGENSVIRQGEMSREKKEHWTCGLTSFPHEFKPDTDPEADQNRGPRSPAKFQCPRCDAEVVKSDLNSHMEKAHGLQKFNQLIKRSLRPDMVSSSTEKVGKKSPRHDSGTPKAHDTTVAPLSIETPPTHSRTHGP